MTTSPPTAPVPPDLVAPPPTLPDLAELPGTRGPVDSRIETLRADITAVDEQIMDLVARRIGLSREVGSLRMAAGGTRLSLSREQVIVDRFTTALGADGTALAMLLLRAGRGRL